jgi:glutamine cyclotransferase
LNVKAQLNDWLRRWQTAGLRRIRPEIVRVIDHDPGAFTQGLLFANDRLYESTGSWGESSLRQLCPDTGNVLEHLPVVDEFAEDIAYLEGRIYQLTWTSGRVLVYETEPLRLVEEYKTSYQGWGVAAYGSGLIATDGTHLIRRFDAEMRLIEQRSIRCRGFPFRHLNALEVVADRAYVNVWNCPLIAQLDVAEGRVAGVIDCTEIQQAEDPKSAYNIMNGVCYLPQKRTFLITGKHWRNMFEIRIPVS